MSAARQAFTSEFDGTGLPLETTTRSARRRQLPYIRVLVRQVVELPGC
jgi:hypothetical protein